MNGAGQHRLKVPKVRVLFTIGRGIPQRAAGRITDGLVCPLGQVVVAEAVLAADNIGIAQGVTSCHGTAKT